MWFPDLFRFFLCRATMDELTALVKELEVLPGMTKILLVQLTKKIFQRWDEVAADRSNTNWKYNVVSQIHSPNAFPRGGDFRSEKFQFNKQQGKVDRSKRGWSINDAPSSSDEEDAPGCRGTQTQSHRIRSHRRPQNVRTTPRRPGVRSLHLRPVRRSSSISIIRILLPPPPPPH